MQTADTTLSGKTALVTGSTSGIGWAIARAFAGHGCNIMLHGLGAPEDVRAKVRELETEFGVSVAAHDADLSKPAEADRLVADTTDAFHALDIVVNNAGIQFISPVEDFPLEQWDAIQSIILHSSFRTIRAAVPVMKRRGWGRIINLASAHALIASPFKSAYVAAKHGQVGLTRTVALELAETNITCNAVCPGYVRTKLVEEQLDRLAETHRMSREQVVRDVVLAAQPSKRFVEPEEVAALVLFLCSDQARSITGAAIPIDGGWTAR